VTAVLYSQTLGTPVKLEAQKGKASGFEDGRGREQAPEVFLCVLAALRTSRKTADSLLQLGPQYVPRRCTYFLLVLRQTSFTGLRPFHSRSS
jgi:hypothetical protein